MYNSVHPDLRILIYIGIFGNQFSGHQGNIPGRCHMTIRVQSITVFKDCIFHTKTFGTLIHLLDKGFFCSGNQLCHGHASVIGAGHDDAF